MFFASIDWTDELLVEYGLTADHAVELAQQAVALKEKSS